MKNSTVSANENCDFIIENDGFRILFKIKEIVKGDAKASEDVMNTIEMIVRNTSIEKSELKSRLEKINAIEKLKELEKEHSEDEIGSKAQEILEHLNDEIIDENVVSDT